MKTIVVAGTCTGVGKSTIALGLMAACSRRGLRVQPYKIGPDFLDPLHHTAATGRDSFNLDTWMLSRDANLTCFRRCVPNADIAIVEGVMGLYDGYDGKSEHGSTAEMAKLLNAPVLLVFDCWALARSAAAMLRGYITFDSHVKFAGIIFNKVSGPSHTACLKEALSLSDVKVHVFGAIPKVGGLQHSEQKQDAHSVDENVTYLQQLADLVELHLDLDAILEEAAACEPDEILCHKSSPSRLFPKSVRIGIARDAAFCFHYHENLCLLQDAGAELVFFSPLKDSLPSSLDAIFFGGGYVSLYLDRLSANKQLLYAVRAFASAGGIVYGESGGLMYLSQGVEDLCTQLFPMSGVFPFWTRFGEQMRSGYVKVTPQDNCVIFPAEIGEIRGFMYSSCEIFFRDGSSGDSCCKGFIIKNDQDTEDMEWEGYMQGNAMSTLVHLHFGSNLCAAHALVERCRMDRTKAAAIAAASASAVAGAGPVAAAAAGAAAAEAVVAAMGESKEIIPYYGTATATDVKGFTYQAFSRTGSTSSFKKRDDLKEFDIAPYSPGGGLVSDKIDSQESACTFGEEAYLRRAESFDLHRLRRTNSMEAHPCKVSRSESEIWDKITGPQRDLKGLKHLHCDNLLFKDIWDDGNCAAKQSRGKSTSIDFDDVDLSIASRNTQNDSSQQSLRKNAHQAERYLSTKVRVKSWNCNGAPVQKHLPQNFSQSYRFLGSERREKFPKKIVSLLPLATEILIELGAGNRLMAITDCCDRPSGVGCGRYIVGRSRMDAASVSSTKGDWKPYLGCLARKGGKLKLDVSWLGKVKPDLIVTEDVSEEGHDNSTLKAALAQAGLHSGKNTRIQVFRPHTVSEVFDSILDLGDTLGLFKEACLLVDFQRMRLRKVAASVAHQRPPRILLLQGLNPLILGGHWIPEVESLAGGFDGLQKPGCGLEMLHWQRIISYAPEVLVLSPCTLTVDQTLSEVELLARLHGFWSIPAVEAGRVYICEPSCFSFPGLRMVDGVELLACILHPFATTAVQVQESAWKLSLSYGQQCSPQDLPKHFKPCL